MLCVCVLFGLDGQMWLIVVVIDEWMFVCVCVKDCFLSLCVCEWMQDENTFV